MSETLLVGVDESPPFVTYNEELGAYTGISIDLWEQVAAKLDLKYQYVAAPNIANHLDGLANSKLDLVISPLTITSARESKIDFTVPFYNDSLGIATKTTRTSSDMAIESLCSAARPLGGLLVGLLIAGAIYKWIERHRDQAPDWISSIYWASATSVTVGYGDEAAKTGKGKLFSIFWMISGLFFTSWFTAHLSAAAFLSAEVQITELEQLRGKSVITVMDTAPDTMLTQLQIPHEVCPTVEKCVLELNYFDYVVYDYAALRDAAPSSVQIIKLPVSQAYAFGLPPGSPMRQSLNINILSLLETKWWTTVRDP